MKILGLSGAVHDAAAALLIDGQLVAAVEEERFKRVKHIGFAGYFGHDSGLPHASIDYCLKTAGITADQIDAVGYFYDPWREFRSHLGFRLARAYRDPARAAYHLVQSVTLLKDHLKTEPLFNRRRQHPLKFHWLSHYATHNAAAFFCSPFDEALILSIDAKGERDSCCVAVGKGNQIRTLETIPYPHSWGMFYMEVTKYLGFKPGHDEYKVMGLASFGKPTYLDQFRQIVKTQSDGSFRFDMRYFDPTFTGPDMLGKKFYDTFGPARVPNSAIDSHHEDIAASLQQILEECVLRYLEKLRARTGQRNLCLSGGVVLNCVLNGKILESGLFDGIFIPPNPGDAGCAVGAALHIHHQLQHAPRGCVMDHAFLGPAFSDDEIRAALDNAKLDYRKMEDTPQEVARLIADGKIVAWFQGRMEWGPRALGNRSLLADPTRAEMRDVVNKWVKHREDFRPFAPSVLEEEVSKYFEHVTDSPFMLFITKVKTDKRSKVPAITHVDGTARPQTVSRRTNPLYWQVIKEFENLTGVPCVLNTSFNIMGEPIVCTPPQAIRCFYGTGIDALAIGSYLVTKPRA
ncbi:MAG: carbamoyltransferase [Verrucomicrobiota bacterium]